MPFPRLAIAALLSLCTLAPLLRAAAKAKPTSPDDATAYQGAIVTDAATGAVLYENRADYAGPPASMTKLMTFAVLHDKIAAGTLSLAAPVRIMNEDNIGGTQVFLDPRETFPVEELIHAMMIQSANDAARALARFAAGSVPAFVELMNAKARQLGMTRTTFHTPHGLPPATRRLEDTDSTTPRDYALLCRHLLQNTTILKYSAIKQRDFGPERAKGPMKMDNHNKLLGKVAGVDGLKTGYTAAAGYCTSITAQRNGRRVIVVIMGSFGPGGQRDLGKTRDLKAVELLERGFAALPVGGPAFTPAQPSATTSPVSIAPPPPKEKLAAPSDGTPPPIKLNIPGAKK
jgi:D-alanyl-D-alanine carboxypeptidase